MSADLGPGPHTRVRRLPAKAAYDEATVFAILDAAPVAHVAAVVDGEAAALPTLVARDGRALYLHGSPGNAVLRAVVASGRAFVTATLYDGLRLARSGFESSIAYRSAVVVGRARALAEGPERDAALTRLVDAVLPGRAAEVRAMTESEARLTLVVRVEIDEASAKVSAGPTDDPDDDARARRVGRRRPGAPGLRRPGRLPRGRRARARVGARAARRAARAGPGRRARRARPGRRPRGRVAGRDDRAPRRPGALRRGRRRPPRDGVGLRRVDPRLPAAPPQAHRPAGSSRAATSTRARSRPPPPRARRSRRPGCSRAPGRPSPCARSTCTPGRGATPTTTCATCWSATPSTRGRRRARAPRSAWFPLEEAAALAPDLAGVIARLGAEAPWESGA